MIYPRKPAKVKWIGLLLVGLTLLLIPAALALAANGFHLVARPASGGEPASGGAYSLQSVIGQPEAGKLTGNDYRLNGGVLGEVVHTPTPTQTSTPTPDMTGTAMAHTATAAFWQTSTASAQTATAAAWTKTPTPTPDGPQTIYLPLVLKHFSPPLEECEPNNLFGEANLIERNPTTIWGQHDGAANTGDVFMLDDDLVTAGNIVAAAINTDNPAGLQLIAYDPQGVEIARDYDDDHAISFIVPVSGSYYIYVFTDPGANNTAAYKLTITVSP